MRGYEGEIWVSAFEIVRLAWATLEQCKGKGEGGWCAVNEDWILMVERMERDLMGEGGVL